MATELTKLQQIQESIATLKSALVSANPGMPTMLRTIHNNLSRDKDIVTLLTEDEIGILVTGLMAQTNTVIAAVAVKKTTKSLKAIGIDDL